MLGEGRAALTVGDTFVHESVIGSLLEGRVEGLARVGHEAAIISAGWARLTGLNTILVDAHDVRARLSGALSGLDPIV